MHFEVRPAQEADATAIGLLAQQFAEYLRSLGDETDFQFGPAEVLRDGFGANPAFTGIVAERQAEILGYLLYHFGYDTDRGVRQLHVIDLYVRDDARRQGIGHALMNAAAAICREHGGRELFWSVYEPNQLAANFYERLGGRYLQVLKFMTWPVSDQTIA